MHVVTAPTIFPSGLSFYPHTSPVQVVINFNGGTVAIEADGGNGTWVHVPGSPFAQGDDAVFHLEVAKGRFRVTPSGGATVGWSE